MGLAPKPAPSTSWKKPGPKAGPFKAYPGDGSVVTYHWYRFADQPALLNADMTEAEREAMQAKVEKLHRAWTKDREYLAPPTIGKLADVDPAQVVTPAWFILEFAKTAPLPTGVVATLEPAPTWQTSQDCVVGMWLDGRPTTLKLIDGIA